MCLLRWMLFQLLPAWLCLGLSLASTAAAAADEEAPMCDLHAASVAAPTEIPEVDRGKLQELPCDALLRWVGSGLEPSDSDGPAAIARDTTPPHPPELRLDRSRPAVVLDLSGALPERAAPQSMAEPPFTGLPPRQGHRSPVYRPPLRG
jgi:hypothetical protein